MMNSVKKASFLELVMFSIKLAFIGLVRVLFSVILIILAVKILVDLNKIIFVENSLEPLFSPLVFMTIVVFACMFYGYSHLNEYTRQKFENLRLH